jgi:hypothetical protein
VKTYALNDGGTLVLSIDRAPWQTARFDAADFADIRRATAAELVRVLKRIAGLAPAVDGHGDLVLATAAKGPHASLDVDVARSTAAGALGLGDGILSAVGSGLWPAMLETGAAEPFAIPAGAELTVETAGRRRVVRFTTITPGAATAQQVATALNGEFKGIAHRTRAGTVVLRTNAVGPATRLRIDHAARTHPDAAAPLGLVGSAAFNQPYRAEPARLVCRGRRAGLHVVNLTGNQIELHSDQGTTLLPARGSVSVTPNETAQPQLQRLVRDGLLRLAAVEEP